MKRRREMEKVSEIRSAIEELTSSSMVKAKPVGVQLGQVENNNNNNNNSDDVVVHQDALALPSSHIPTKPFLSVCNLVIQVLDKIGPTMAVLRQDIYQNIQVNNKDAICYDGKLRLESIYESEPSIYSNMVEILKKEAQEGNTRKTTSCSRSFVWLTRSMDFTVGLLQRLAREPDQSMEKAVEEAYNVTLRPWHGWISSAAFRVAMKLLPDNKTFIGILSTKKEAFEDFKEETQTLASLLMPLLEEMHSVMRFYKLEKIKST